MDRLSDASPAPTKCHRHTARNKEALRREATICHAFIHVNGQACSFALLCPSERCSAFAPTTTAIEEKPRGFAEWRRTTEDPAADAVNGSNRTGEEVRVPQQRHLGTSAASSSHQMSAYSSSCTTALTTPAAWEKLRAKLRGDKRPPSISTLATTCSSHITSRSVSTSSHEAESCSIQQRTFIACSQRMYGLPRLLRS
jgi:hypothetical protein